MKSLKNRFAQSPEKQSKFLQETKIVVDSKDEEEEFFDALTNTRSKITHLVLSGGGAKGVFYPGAFNALLDTYIFDSIEEISGASAGAITAALMAVGVSADELRRQAIEVDVKKLMGGVFKTDGKALLEFIRKSILESVLGHLETILSNYHILLEEQCRCAWRILLDLQGIEGLLEPKPFTFGHLKELNKHFPHIFKKLRVVAFFEPMFGPGRSEFFDTENPENSDVEIALACRASAALPVKLDPVEIKGKRYRDGGLLSNIPVEGYNPKNTLVFVLDEEGRNMNAPVNQVLHGHSFDRILEKLFGEIMTAMEAEQEAFLSSKGKNPSKLKKPTIFIYINDLINKKLNEEIQKKEKEIEKLNAFANILHDSPELNTPTNQAILIKKRQTEKENLLHAKTQRDKIITAMKVIIDQIKLDLDKKNDCYDTVWSEKTVREQLKAAADVMIEHLNPVTSANTWRNSAIDVAISNGAGIEMSMTATEAYVAYCKRLRPFSYVVQMDTTGLIATSSEEATLYAREFMALGYFDTIHSTTNYNLCDPSFPVKKFYTDLFHNFLSIHQCLSQTLLEEKASFNRIIFEKYALEKSTLKRGYQYRKEEIALFMCQKIREAVTNRFSCIEAFALSRAFEVWQGKLTKHVLKKEMLKKIRMQFENTNGFPIEASQLLAIHYAVNKAVESMKIEKLATDNDTTEDNDAKEDNAEWLHLESRISHDEDVFTLPDEGISKEWLTKIHATCLEQMKQPSNMVSVQQLVFNWARVAAIYQCPKQNELGETLNRAIAKRFGEESLGDRIVRLLGFILSKKGDLFNPEIIQTLKSMKGEDTVLNQLKMLFEFYTVHHCNNLVPAANSRYVTPGIRLHTLPQENFTPSIVCAAQLSKLPTCHNLLAVSSR